MDLIVQESNNFRWDIPTGPNWHHIHSFWVVRLDFIPLLLGSGGDFVESIAIPTHHSIVERQNWPGSAAT